MNTSEPTIYDFDSIMAAHAARTAILRAQHPLQRPAIGCRERDSEIRVCMGAAGIVVMFMCVGALAVGAALLVAAFGLLRQALAPISEPLLTWLQALGPAQITAASIALALLAVSLLGAMHFGRHTPTA